MDRERAQLVEHVRQVQRRVRTCEGCGLCCTAAYNSVRILPVEARRIARHVASLPGGRGEDLLGRLRLAVEKFGLKARGGRQPYTCPFLEADSTCALPFDVKPVACLSFNPVSEDRCEMDAGRFELAHAAAASENEAAGSSRLRVPIPVAVLAAAGAPPPPKRPDDGRHPLPRLLSKWHVASRKEAEGLVRSGRVTVNRAVVRDVARVVDPGRDRIAVDGKPVAPPTQARAYVLLNKPRGFVTTTSDPEGRPTVMDLVAAWKAPGLAPVGRLDRDSAGVLLLTNDHALAARVLDPASHVRKRYRVKVKGLVRAETLERMRAEHVESGGLRLAPFEEAEVESAGPRSTWLRITIDEGKNRQIRRQCEAFGHEVEIVVRMAFGPLEIGSLKPGAARALTDAEVRALRGGR
jgi:23S rRNA pseudouridine2605 synthase